MKTKFGMIFDGSIHSTGVSYLRHEQGGEVNVLATKTIKVDEKIKGEKACIQMLYQVFNMLKDFQMKIDVIVCEIQKPHGEAEVMSMQGFSHLNSIPIAILGYAAFCGKETYYYSPVEWKGTVKKPVMTQRLYEKEIELGTDRKLFSLKEHDILDSIGLGRFHFEQMEYLRRTGR